MTAHPNGLAGRIHASQVNRVAKINNTELADTNPDVLAQVKREVNVLDLLEVSNNAAWVTAVATLPAKYKKMFEVGTYSRLRYRYFVYGLDPFTLSDLLSYLILANYGNTAILGWLRLGAPGTTITGSGYSSVVDVLNSNPAIQATDANRPINGTSANGLPIATFSTHFLQWSLNASNNGATKMGIAGYFKLANVVGNKTLAVSTLTAGGASANKVLYMANANQIRCDDQTVDRHAVSVNTVDTAWRFLTMEIDCTQVAESAKVIQTIDGVVSVTSFSSDTAWSATMGVPTGNMLIGAGTTGAASPFVGSMGPNLYFLGRQLTGAERTSLINFEKPV